MTPENENGNDARMTRMENDIKKINENIAKLYATVRGVTNGDKIWHDTMCIPNQKKLSAMEKEVARIDKEQSGKWPVLLSSFAGSVIATIAIAGTLFALYKGVSP